MINCRVIEIISEYKGIPIMHISLSSRFMDDLSFNSFELLDLACYFEDEFNVSISEDMMREWRTVNDVIYQIKSLLE